MGIARFLWMGRACVSGRARCLGEGTAAVGRSCQPSGIRHFQAFREEVGDRNQNVAKEGPAVM